MECIRQLKAIMDGLELWEAEVELEREMAKKIDEGLGP
jgi:hypothetical protein